MKEYLLSRQRSQFEEFKEISKSLKRRYRTAEGRGILFDFVKGNLKMILFEIDRKDVKLINNFRELLMN